MKVLIVNLLLLMLVNNIFCQSINNVTEEECITKVCLLDSLRLFEYATDDEFIEPCENFTEYSLEKFLKINSVLDDKFSFNSLSYHQKRQRKMLHAEINEDELKGHKIAKNFFQKCIDTSKFDQKLRELRNFSNLLRLHSISREARGSGILE